MKLSTRWLAALGTSAVLATGTAPVAAASSSSGAAAPSADDIGSAILQSYASADRVGIERPVAGSAVDRAINPDDYQCGPTDFSAYIDGLIDGLSLDELIFLVNHIEMLDIPTYDALYFGTDTDHRYDLRSDSQQSLTKTFTDVKRFWDIDSGDIQLMAMHGSMLQDAPRVARVLQLPLAEFGMSRADAEAEAADIAEMASQGFFDGGDNPLFTLNAFAFTAEGDPDPSVAGLPDKLIFGDGILDALQALGIESVGARAVMGHEFGHHVQFEDGLFSSPLTGAEATRRTELMADAFGTYFVTHARGLALNAKRVLQAEETSFEVGDCQFASPGHHGTPLQRLRSATWAADLAAAARPQGHIMPSLTFADLFEQELPEIVAPDA